MTGDTAPTKPGASLTLTRSEPTQPETPLDEIRVRMRRAPGARRRVPSAQRLNPGDALTDEDVSDVEGTVVELPLVFVERA